VGRLVDMPYLRTQASRSTTLLTRTASSTGFGSGLAECIGCHKHRVDGDPDPKHVSTSFAERQNLNVRMHTRRFTRLTNAFSKKVENHAHSVALFAMYYNFVRIHKTLRTTPAMAAGVTKRLWEIGDIVYVLEAWEAAPPAS
jgi:hypothetical protein